MNNLADDIIEIKVFGNDDESLKVLGQLLSNETSRNIIQLLTQEEMYTNQISNRLEIQMNITIFHLKKLVDLGLVMVTHKQIVKKGVDHKYYKMVPNMFVTSTQTKKEVHENGFLKKFFKEGVKLTVIGVASFFVWEIFDKSQKFSKEKISLNNKVYPLPQDLIEPLIWVPVIIIVCGILLIWFRKLRKKGK